MLGLGIPMYQIMMTASPADPIEYIFQSIGTFRIFITISAAEVMRKCVYLKKKEMFFVKSHSIC